MATPSISSGNSKIGKIYNINLPPPIVCKDMPCLNTGCYAMKAWRLYPSVRESWTKNWNLYRENPVKYFQDIISKISRIKTPVKYFRWHSAGEIPDQKYLNGMFRVAIAFPEIHFLVFSKRYDLDITYCPENLQIIFSTWPGHDIPKGIKSKYNLAWMEDGTQMERIQSHNKKTYECAGSCVTCKKCWHLNKIKRDVIFRKH